MTRKAVASLVVSALISMITVVTASPASASVFTNRFRAAGTTLCLDGYATRPVSDIYVTGCNTGPFQRWRWDNVGETWMQSQAAGTTCMQQAGTQVDLVACRLVPAQYWVVELPRIRKWGTNLCLTRQAPHVRLTTCNGSIYQQWQVA